MAELAMDGARGRPTGGREAVAYAIAHLLRIAAAVAVGLGNVLGTIYQWAVTAGGRIMLLPVSIAISAGWMLLALALFLVIRGLIGGTPALVSPARGERAITSARGELGAYVLASAIAIAVLFTANSLFLAPIHASLRRDGQAALSLALGVGVNVLVTTAMFLLFLLLRRAFTGGEARTAVVPEAPVGRSDLVGIGGWLVFPAIGCVLGPIVGGIGLIVSLSQFANVARAEYGGLFALELLVQVGILALILYVAVVFFPRKRSAPAAYIALLVTVVVSSVVLLAIELAAGAEVFAAESAKGLVRGGIGAAIWIPYFKFSERVRMTFVN